MKMIQRCSHAVVSTSGQNSGNASQSGTLSRDRSRAGAAWQQGLLSSILGDDPPRNRSRSEAGATDWPEQRPR